MKKLKMFGLCICFLALSSCSPKTGASGEIVDINGTPLANVKVEITGKSLYPNSEMELLTAPDGKYSFDEIRVSSQLPIEIKLSAEKEGVKTLTRDLKFNEDNVDKIVLEKLRN